jgi:predicted TIM-barrel fold metal-dependent hydrolase
MAKQVNRIDAWGHVLPPRYRKALSDQLPADAYWRGNDKNTGFDMDNLLGAMNELEGHVMVLTIASPPIEVIDDPRKAAELARISNDEMAEMLAKYPDKFVAAIANLPMNDIDAALKEADRAINELKFRGVQIYTPTNGKPIDGPEFLPLYEEMEKYDLPIYLHPTRLAEKADYVGETRSKYCSWLMVGWPYETSVAMLRLVCSGVMEKYPNLKIVVHHTGVFIPNLESRLIEGEHNRKEMTQPVHVPKLTKGLVDYFKRFYTEIELRTTPVITLAHSFYGPEHILYGVGIPHGFGILPSIKWSTEGVQNMDISDKEKQMIFKDNVIKLLRLEL